MPRGRSNIFFIIGMGKSSLIFEELAVVQHLRLVDGWNREVGPPQGGALPCPIGRGHAALMTPSSPPEPEALVPWPEIGIP